MQELAERVGYPQKRGPSAGEVVLTRAESRLFALLVAEYYGRGGRGGRGGYFGSEDPFFEVPTEDAVSGAAAEAGVTEKQLAFLRCWIKHKGDLVALTEALVSEPSEVPRYLTFPVIFRILSELANKDASYPTPIPTREELAAAWGFVSRSPSAPSTFQRDARQEIAKLMGYYAQGSDAVNVGVQVIVKGDLTSD